MTQSRPPDCALALFALAAMVGLTAFLTHGVGLDRDVAYFLASARILLQGAELYVDYVSVNTLGPFLLGMASTSVSQQIGTPLDQTHKYLLILLSGGLLSLAVLMIAPAFSRSRIGLLVTAVGLAAVTLLTPTDFGRREFLLFLCVLPWGIAITLAHGGVRPARLVSIATGIGVGFALFLKPHFALVATALGLVDLWQSRGRIDQLTVETVVGAAVTVTLYAGFLLAYPRFLAEAVPMSLDTYGQLSPGPLFASLSFLTGEYGKPVALLLGGCIAIRLLDPLTPWFAHASRVILVFLLGATVLAVMQGFGWRYHAQPVRLGLHVSLVFVLAWGVTWAERKLSGARIRRAFGGLVVLGLALAVAVLMLRMATMPPRVPEPQRPLLEALRPPSAEDSVLFVSPNVNPHSALLSTIDVRYAGAGLHHWLIPVLARQIHCSDAPVAVSDARLQEIETWYRDIILRRFQEQPPVRVAVEVSDRLLFYCTKGFDQLAWLRKDPRFDAAWRAAGLVPDPDLVGVQRSFQIWRSP